MAIEVKITTDQATAYMVTRLGDVAAIIAIIAFIGWLMVKMFKGL